MRIACLHTADSNIAVFAACCPAPAIELRHEVRADLLAAAEQAGHVTREIAARTADALARLSLNSDAVLLTCSTLGPVVRDVVVSAAVPVLRVDAALAAAAMSVGRRVVALCAVETTIAPTRMLFEAAAVEHSAAVEVRLVPAAWKAFQAGRIADYHAMIATAADQAYRDGADVVALAQASMAGAADLCREGRPLTSPAVGLAAALQAAENFARRRSPQGKGEMP
jgi:Asp/Glu/hydantoin racemase